MRMMTLIDDEGNVTICEGEPERRPIPGDANRRVAEFIDVKSKWEIRRFISTGVMSDRGLPIFVLHEVFESPDRPALVRLDQDDDEEEELAA